MGTALECPVCGHKHRLGTLSGDTLFPCAACGRTLKLPVEYRRPEPSRPATAGGPRARDRRAGASAGSTGHRSATATATRGQAARPAANRPLEGSRAAPASGVGRRPLAPPFQALSWVVGFGLGGFLVIQLAQLTGWISGDRVIDLLTGTSVLRYARVLALVPVWALVSTVLATLSMEGLTRFIASRRAAARARGGAAAPRERRRASAPGGGAVATRPSSSARPKAAPSTPVAPVAPARRAPSSAAPREPQGSREPPPVAPSSRPASPDQPPARERRIPRRGVAS